MSVTGIRQDQIAGSCPYHRTGISGDENGDSLRGSPLVMTIFFLMHHEHAGEHIGRSLGSRLQRDHHARQQL